MADYSNPSGKQMKGNEIRKKTIYKTIFRRHLYLLSIHTAADYDIDTYTVKTARVCFL